MGSLEGRCVRRSRPGFPGASPLARLRSAPQMTWRARFGARRPLTASTRSASARRIRTGPIGTPSTWWRSKLGRNCRRERTRDWAERIVTLKNLVTPPKKGARMSTIHLHQTTTSTPEQYVAGLTDLGPCRSNLFGNSADEYLKGLGAFMRAVTELFGPEQAGRGLGR